MLLISQAFIEHQDGVSLHPDLILWQEKLLNYRRRWFETAARNPLSWYAALTNASPAALLAASHPDLPHQFVQWWVASPYHAGVTRTSVRVMPEGQFPWSAADAKALCAALNPLLEPEGMALFATGAAILCGCREPIEAFPQGFGAISGQSLPDRHHEGVDGGRLNRLLSEIQMLLFQHPLIDRHERGEPEVTGIWLWSPIEGGVEWPQQRPAVATRNPVLQSIVDGNGADVIISESERVGELLQSDGPLPERIVLAGSEHALLLKQSMLARLSAKGRRAAGWQAEKAQSESALLTTLQRW